MICSTIRKAFLRGDSKETNGIPFRMMDECSKSGCTQCGFGVANCYLSGYGCSRNIQFARKLLSKGDPECPISQYVDARCFDEGLGVGVDKAKAFTLYQNSAQAGFAPAQKELALIFSIGEDVPADFSQSMHWHKLAAQQGLGNSMFFIGLAYERGEGVEVSKEEARKWYASALQAGYELASGKLRMLTKE